MQIPPEPILKLKATLDKARTDAAWVADQETRNHKRKLIQQEIAELLNSLLAGKVSISEFRVTFDAKTRKEWDGFGLKGLSGAMFLNKLVKHVPDQSSLTDELRRVTLVPADANDGRKRMTDFLSYLQGLIANHLVSKEKIQPARSTFFLSAMWHMQDKDRWPIYYESARAVFKDEGIFVSSGDPVSDYFSFREAWLELIGQLSLTAWDLEGLLSVVNKGLPPEPPSPEDETTQPEEPIEVHADEIPQHTQVQWMLAKIGQKFGCKIWIAANDRSKVWENETLGSLSLSTLPNLGIGNDAQKIVSLIDVLWLKGSNQVVAAFEVESTTSIYSGILRMSDLAITCPNLTFDCFIAIPQSRAADVIRQLSRPTFQYLELHKRCRFFSFEDLKKEIDSIMKWAKDPSSMRDLAKSVGDVGE